VPLFVEELTKAVVEADADRGHASLAAVPPSSLTVPATLHASLLGRLDRLGPSAKTVAQVGAAIGRDFSHELLAAAAPLPEPELQEALRRASSDSRLLAARQDAPFPGNFLLRPHAPIFDTRPAAAFPPIRSISNLRARAVCASPYGIDGPPRPSRALVAPMVFRRSDGASSRERCPHAASFSSRRGLRH